jgi:AcrR family transcriptional regulator
MSRHRTVRQQEIIESARRIISTKGIENLSTRIIAKDLGVTNAALYKHFKNKEKILSLLIDDIEDVLLATIQKAADASSDPLQKLENIFLSHFEYSEKMKGTSFTVINSVASIKSRALRSKMAVVLNKYLETIKKIIQEGIKSGVFQDDLDPYYASIVFFGSIQTIVTLWGLDGYKPALRTSRFSGALGIYKSWTLSKGSRI